MSGTGARQRRLLRLLVLTIGVGVAVGLPLSLAGARALSILPAVLLGAAAGMFFGAAVYAVFSRSTAAWVLAAGLLAGIVGANVLSPPWSIAYVPWLVVSLVSPQLGVEIREARRRRRRGPVPSGALLIVQPDARNGWTVTTTLTEAGFREGLAALDGVRNCTLALIDGVARMNVFGSAAGRMVVYYTLDVNDEEAWRRVKTVEAVVSQEEVLINVGGLNGSYRVHDTTSVEIARQAGEYFIRYDGAADPSLVWDESQDALDQLPPVQIEP